MRRRGYRGVYFQMEHVAAVALSVAIEWASVANFAPFRLISDFKHAIRDHWEEQPAVNLNVSTAEGNARLRGEVQ